MDGHKGPMLVFGSDPGDFFFFQLKVDSGSYIEATTKENKHTQL